MQKTIIILTFVIVTFGCGQLDKKTSNIQDTSSINSGDIHPDNKLNWHDSLIINYIKKSDNPLIKYSHHDTAIKIEWFLDRIENADTAKYLIFHIGHDVVDKNDVNMRFVTDGWVYIDSLTKKFYEYDLPNDRLIEWKK
jgi:hypothetical protein